MNKKIEYEMLKQEILNADGYIKSYDTLLYTITGVILTFAFTQMEPLIFLLPIVVIVPTFLLRMAQTESIMRIGSYILIFIEGEKSGWETRLAKFDAKFPPRNPNVSPHIFLSVCCLVLFLLRMDYTNLYSWGFAIRMFVALIFAIICFGIIFLRRVDYKNSKQVYIEQWEEIRKKENEEKKI